MEELFASSYSVSGEILDSFSRWELLGWLSYDFNPRCWYWFIILVIAAFEKRCGDTGPLSSSILCSLDSSFVWALDDYSIVFEAYVWIRQGGQPSLLLLQKEAEIWSVASITCHNPTFFYVKGSADSRGLLLTPSYAKINAVLWSSTKYSVLFEESTNARGLIYVSVRRKWARHMLT